ncbi:hypothetical protein ACFIOY_17925 [Bradyrhizobium sp. TZ2]
MILTGQARRNLNPLRGRAFRAWRKRLDQQWQEHAYLPRHHGVAALIGSPRKRSLRMDGECKHSPPILFKVPARRRRGEPWTFSRPKQADGGELPAGPARIAPATAEEVAEFAHRHVAPDRPGLAGHVIGNGLLEKSAFDGAFQSRRTACMLSKINESGQQSDLK